MCYKIMNQRREKGVVFTKYVIVLADGMADYKLESLGNKTPLQYAKTPHMDWLARHGQVGTVLTVSPDLNPGSDVANLSVMGYDPHQYYTGRSSIEALSMGVALGPEDISLRVNLVTLSEEPAYASRTMLDHSAGNISTAEAEELIKDINRRFGNEEITFYPGLGYRHLMVWKDAAPGFDASLTPPHDILKRRIRSFLPQGKKGRVLLNLMVETSSFLSVQEVNRERVRKGLMPANSLWFWGEGRKITLPSFKEKFGLEGAVISAVDLTKGLGIAMGLKALKVDGATGDLNTNFKGKAQAALEELRKGKDFIYLHVEAPDEAGHRGEEKSKIEAIEKIDAQVLGVLLPGLREFDDFKLMVLPDHPTPVCLRTHVAEQVPFLIYHKNNAVFNDIEGFSEETAALSGLNIKEGHRLMDYFISGKI